MGLFDKLFGGFKRNINSESPKNNSFTTSDNLMDEEVFWKIIKTTKDNSQNNYELQQEQLAFELRRLTPYEINLFDNRFKYLRGKAYTWELWGAIYIIHGGCGDDSFIDFREWVISQGKDFFYKTISNPETLIEIDQDKIDIDWEGMGYIPLRVYKAITGKDMPNLFNENFEITGIEWIEESDDLKNLYPKLYAKYSLNR